MDVCYQFLDVLKKILKKESFKLRNDKECRFQEEKLSKPKFYIACNTSYIIIYIDEHISNQNNYNNNEKKTIIGA